MNFGEFIKGLDFFGAPVNFSIDGQHKIKTKLGGFLSLIFALCSLFYGSLSVYIMVQKLETSFNQNTITNFYNQNDVINSIKQITDAQGKVST